MAKKQYPEYIKEFQERKRQITQMKISKWTEDPKDIPGKYLSGKLLDLTNSQK